jgi:hypothetical protein
VGWGGGVRELNSVMGDGDSVGGGGVDGDESMEDDEDEDKVLER